MKTIDLRQIKTGSPQKLGVTVYENGINFAVEVSMDKDAFLGLYDKKHGELLQEIPFAGNSRIGDVASMFIEDMDPSRYEYAYKIEDEVVLDPYAVLINGNRCGFAKMEEEILCSDYECPWIPMEELILYKLHVRGFTKMADASIKKKGTFRGIEEAIPYFKELGINGIEFMPMYHWMDDLSVKEKRSRYTDIKKENNLKNYWGYGPVNYYFAPKAEFAATKDPIKECKEMIEKLHESGIECIMEIYFPAGIKPSFVLEVLYYWKLTYGVDGFHLIGDGVPAAAVRESPVLKKTKLFFERIDGEQIYGKDTPVYRNVAEYNDDFLNCGRRLLKGDEGQIFDFMYQVRKNYEKTGTVNYMANTNGFTLMDAVSYSCKHNEANGEDNRDGVSCEGIWNWGEEGPTRKKTINMLRKKLLKNAMLYTLLSQGTPLIYQGDESGNSQNGNNNAYAMDNEIGWVNWKISSMGKELLEFTKEAISFRKLHPVLHMEKPLRMTDYKMVRYPDLSYHDEKAWYPSLGDASRCIGMMYCGLYASNEKEEQDDFIYVAYNAYWKPVDLALPRLPEGKCWNVAICTEEADIFSEEALLSNRIQVPERTVIVLTGK